MNESPMGPGRGDEALVERLIRLAERASAAPADGADRVKEALRPLWRAEVRRRTIRRRAAFAALAAAAALVLAVPLLWRAGAPAASPVGRVLVVRGDLRIVSNGEQQGRAAHAGDVLLEGETLRTAGGRAAIALGSGLAVRIDSASRVRLVTARVLGLDEGAVYLESRGGRAEVRTPLGVVRNVGTRFEVRHGGGTSRVRVRDGAVSVEARGTAHRVDRGGELTVSARGARAGTIDPAAASWNWILDVSAPFRIDGASVATFLEWVEAETGLEVVYADTQARRTAREAVLHGDLGSMRADEAPAVILPSAGLEAAIEDGALRVRHGRTTE
jgi:hypothetical protein